MPRPRLAPIERRLFAFLLDFVLAVLIVNSALQLTRPLKWDLMDSVYDEKKPCFLLFTFDCDSFIERT